MDPLAEKAYDWSPYRYGFDNPISTIDPSGMLEEWVDKKGTGQWEWDEEVKSEAAAKEKYGQNARYAESGYTYNTSDGNQVVLQDQGNWSYTSQKIDPDCPTCGLNNGNTGWVEQFQSGIKSYMPLLKASEVMLTADAYLLAGMVAPEAALASRGTQVIASGTQTARGVSVIGPRSIYREFAKKIGANFLNVTDEAWSMRKNVEYLQGVVKRGDDVIFAGKYNPKLLDPKSVLAQEIRYLQRHGYSWTDDLTRLIKK